MLEAKDCLELLKEVRSLHSKQGDVHESSDDVLTHYESEAVVRFYTSDACAICSMYEVLLDHLMEDEYGGVSYDKVYLDEGQNAPLLFLGDIPIDLTRDFNSL